MTDQKKKEEKLEKDLEKDLAKEVQYDEGTDEKPTLDEALKKATEAEHITKWKRTPPSLASQLLVNPNTSRPVESYPEEAATVMGEADAETESMASIPPPRSDIAGDLSDPDEQKLAWGPGEKPKEGEENPKKEHILGMPWRLWDVTHKPTGASLCVFTMDENRAKKNARIYWDTHEERGKFRPVDFEIRPVGADELYPVNVRGVELMLTGKEWVAARLMQLSTAFPVEHAVTENTETKEKE